MFYRTLSLAEIFEFMENRTTMNNFSETDKVSENRTVNICITPPWNGNETQEDSSGEEGACLTKFPGKQIRSNTTKLRERREECEIVNNCSCSAGKKKLK